MTMTGLSVRLRQTRGAGLIAIGVGISAFAVCGLIGLRINSSPSLPIGLYLTTTGNRANLVEFCPAEPFAGMAIERGYRDAGVCRDGAAPLLKPVVAIAGDVVDCSARGISVDGNLLPNTAPIPMDTRGRALTPWPFGRYVVQPGTVWVASSFHPRSFDSRYFGPVQVSAIRDHVRALVTW
jgi:conjugative transfer signal peptidase TraF